jgi:hypothetical protein
LEGIIWARIRKEIGEPYDVKATIEGWLEEQWRKILLIEG